ncbi:MAG: hypothetical protein ACKPE6_09190 [Gammaproteobacteria bacterium]
MAVPTREALKDWARNYVDLWNAGDRAGWAANWRRVAPGEFTMLDPVGTSQKRGFEHCALDSFDLFQPSVKYRIQPGTFFICGDEVAWLMENHIDQGGGQTRLGFSIETYRFGEDGSVEIRTFYKVPTHREGHLGALYQTYLPGNPDGA